MDTSQPQAIESFSYRWLATDHSESHKTISNNNRCLPFNNEANYNHNNQNFDFDISMSNTNPSLLVHADKLFSNGLILPRPLNNNNYDASSSSPSPLLLVNSKIHHHPSSSSSYRKIFMLKKWSKFVPGKILGKYIKCLIPMKGSIGRCSTRVDDVNRIAWEVVATPRTRRETHSADYYSSSWNDIDDCSIREAILYCKRSSNGAC